MKSPPTGPKHDKRINGAMDSAMQGVSTTWAGASCNGLGCTAMNSRRSSCTRST
jgi:hypothetical protein